MKLHNKILVSNIVLSVIIFLLTSVGMYFLVNDTIYEELDNHLLQHKIDIMNQLQESPQSINEIKDLGGLGSYEWIDIASYDGSVKPFTNTFTTIDTARSEHEVGPDSYRRLATTISVDDRYYTLRIYEEVAAWDNISTTILISILAALLIWILLLYLVNQAVFDRVLTPFYATVDSLEKISDPNDFTETFPSSTTDEINVLNEALNSMMRQIRSSFEDQKKFIQNASHELLTPLSIIRQKAEKILSNPESLDRETIKAVNNIQQTAVRLSRLSNALLLISRVENRQFSLDEEVNIKEVSDDVVEEMEDFLAMKHIAVDEEVDPGITVQGNKELIHSAIYNIIQNAVKFSPQDSTIRIATNGSDDHHELSITDEGPGIPTELKDKVFDRFKKAGMSLNGASQDNGSGLGLSLVKSICQLHGFRCSAQNTGDSGAEFTIQF